jgi:hypothetical protein
MVALAPKTNKQTNSAGVLADPIVRAAACLLRLLVRTHPGA